MSARPLVPSSLKFRDGLIQLAGAGKLPGSRSYMDLRTGRSVEVYVAQVVRTGPLFLQAEVLGNRALAVVRVDNHLFAGTVPEAGSPVLVGDLEFNPAGPRARAAWRTCMVGDRPAAATARPGTNGHAPATTRRDGVVSQVALAGTFGRIVMTGSPEPVFVHVRNMRHISLLQVGTRVNFVLSRNDRGLEALDVRSARP